MDRLTERRDHERPEPAAATAAGDSPADSGIFDLAALRREAEQRRPDEAGADALLAYGVAGPLRAAPRTSTARSDARRSDARRSDARRSGAPPRKTHATGVLAWVATLALFTSVALAMRPASEPRGAVLALADPAPTSQTAFRVHADYDVAPPAAEPAEVRTTRARTSTRTRPSVAPARTREAAPVPESPVGDRSIEELMRLASGMPSQTSTEARGGDPAEPSPLRTLRPDRSDVATLMRSRSRAVQQCGEGVATASVVFDGSTGRARSVRVRGVDEATASCVEGALQGLALDPFLQTRLEVNFPYRL